MLRNRKYPIFFNLFKSCFDASLLYPPGNPALAKQFDNFLKGYPQFLGDDGKIDLSFENNLFLFNSRRLGMDMVRMPVVSWFMNICQDRKMLHIVIEDGVTEKEVEKFIGLLHMETRKFPDFETASSLLHRQQVQRIQINPVSTDATFSNLPAFSALPNIQPPVFTESPLMAPVETVAPPEADEEPAPAPKAKVPLFLPESDQDALYYSMLRFIQEKKLKKVAEALTLMHRDLKAGDREVREIAYSSYHVVVQSLIETKQNKPLFSILKSLLPDFQICKEPDLFAIHLETLASMIGYFRKSRQMSPLVYGLNILANQVLYQNEANQACATSRLPDLFDEELVVALLQNQEPQLKPLLTSLFVQNGRGIAKPLLDTLFASEHRGTRKKLLDLLAGVGSAIHPLLLDELREAIKNGKPWYMKRNLLTLLAIQPPEGLADHLEALTREAQPKLLDLVYRCIYKIEAPAAVDLGKRQLTGAPAAKLTKLLSYVGSGGNDAFIPVLADMYGSGLPDFVKLEIIHTLSAYDTSESVDCLVAILEGDVRGSKDHPQGRVAAARALSESAQPKALTAFTKLLRDPDRTLRQLAKSVLSETGLPG